MSRVKTKTFKVTVSSRSPITKTLQLQLEASAPIPATCSTLVNSPLVHFQVQIQIKQGQHSETLPPKHVQDSQLVKVIARWLHQNARFMCIDSVEEDDISHTSNGVLVPVTFNSHRLAFTEISMQTLSQPSPTLDKVQLCFRFCDASVSSLSDLNCNHLRNKLLDNQWLHYTLQPLIHDALKRIAERLTTSFPLCFNASFIKRLETDLINQRQVAMSLMRVKNRINPQSSLSTRASLLTMQLEQHLTSIYNVNDQSHSSTSINPARAIELGLLLLTRDHGPKDSFIKETKRNMSVSTGRKRTRAQNESDSLEVESSGQEDVVDVDATAGVATQSQHNVKVMEELACNFALYQEGWVEDDAMLQFSDYD
ncbi:hypothetical protein OIO90_006187 [Microbotryomycetes sp. JL221]|nr:hypothetical protein OIO90_006187 [Microbotryomycetes sp. JL221]